MPLSSALTSRRTRGSSSSDAIANLSYSFPEVGDEGTRTLKTPKGKPGGCQLSERLAQGTKGLSIPEKSSWRLLPDVSEPTTSHRYNDAGGKLANTDHLDGGSCGGGPTEVICASLQSIAVPRLHEVVHQSALDERKARTKSERRRSCFCSFRGANRLRPLLTKHVHTVVRGESGKPRDLMRHCCKRTSFYRSAQP